MSTIPKHIVITGPTAGIGRAAALSLASQGAQLTLLCRNLEKGLMLSEAIESGGGLKPHLVQMDMASLQSVRTAAASVLDLGLSIISLGLGHHKCESGARSFWPLRQTSSTLIIPRHSSA